MRRISISTHNNEINDKRTEFRDTLIYLLHQLTVSLILEANASPRYSKDQYRAATSILLSACCTGESISRLLRELSLCSKDAMPLARAFYESLLNAAYILCGEESIAERVTHYTIYREFKDQTRHYKLGDTKAVIASRNRLSRKDPRVRRALEIFEPTNAKGDRRCFGAEREERIEVIANSSRKAGISFAGAEGMHWGFASEIAHGTLYGHEYSTGQLPRPLISEVSIPEEIPFICNTVIALCCNAIGEIMADDTEYRRPARTIIEAAKIYFHDEVPEFLNER